MHKRYHLESGYDEYWYIIDRYKESFISTSKTLGELEVSLMNSRWDAQDRPTSAISESDFYA